MGTIVLILSFVLGLIMIIGLIKPARVLKFSEKPSRGKVFFFFGVPAFLMFIIFGMLYESALDVALKDPENTYSLKISTGYLREVPPEVAQLINLEILDLNNNKITEIPDIVRNLKKLEVLDLGRNPIDKVPIWLATLPALKEINLFQTQVKQIPAGFEQIAVNYEGTPLWRAEHPEEVTTETSNDLETSTSSGNKGHTESLGEFAVRKLLGEDYGYKRKFLKGEIYYNEPVTIEQTDKVGETMQSMGIFTNEKEVSMLLDKNEDGIYELKMVIDESIEIDQEARKGFSALRGLVHITGFSEDELHLHLTNNQFETIEIIKE